MGDRYTEYRAAHAPATAKHRLLPLYGAGFENLGRDGQPISVDLPRLKPDELLVRHDAVGLCFSDIKIIAQGEHHPRLQGRNLKQDPVVMGHEVIMTVVAVGEQLKGQYRPGDRFIIQADIYVQGVNLAYGYKIQGGLAEYGVIDQRILDGDHGNYLIPVKETTVFAESALAEPWACVVAAYLLNYRTGLKNGGTAWFIGAGNAKDEYRVSAGFDEASHPARVLLTRVPRGFASELRARAGRFGVEVLDVPAVSKLPAPKVDDIVLLGADADLVEAVSPSLAQGGIVALLSDAPLSRPVKVDVGRIHYEDWLYVGTDDADVARAYARTPVRPDLLPGGRAFFVGAGGPIGRMHLQRAIHRKQPPKVIVCSDASDVRLEDLRQTFAEEAAAKGIRFVCLNPMQKEEYAKGMAEFEARGFDDIVVLAPVPPVIAEASRYFAEKGVMNIFAGVARGTFAEMDLSFVIRKQARVMGHSASSIEDMREVLRQIETGGLDTNRSVAAIGSLEASKDGLLAVKNATYPGKVVIFPHLKPLPVTPLPELKGKLPTVYAKLRNGREWTLEAEQELFRVMLKD
jgi:threonine dehydrogenase-like Zn-dependent dehydrogenase